MRTDRVVPGMVAFALAGVLAAVEPAPPSVVPATSRTPLAEQSLDVVQLTDGTTITGTVVEREADGALRVAVKPDAPAVRYAADRIVRHLPRRTFSEAVALRAGEALKARDWRDLGDVVRKLAARPAPEPACVLALEATITTAVQSGAGTGLVDAWLDQGARSPQVAALDAAAGRVAAATLAVAPNWERGYGLLVARQEAAGDEPALRQTLAAWLKIAPGGPVPLRALARWAERQGDGATAADAWRRLWEAHGDAEGGLSTARWALRRGDAKLAAQAARVAVEAGPPHAANARSWLAAALLRQGVPDAQVEPFLTQALAGTGGNLDAEAMTMARHHLALLRWRAGRVRDADALWAQVDHPVARFGRALAAGHEAPDPGPGADPVLAARQRLHALALDLMGPDLSALRQALPHPFPAAIRQGRRARQCLAQG